MPGAAPGANGTWTTVGPTTACDGLDPPGIEIRSGQEHVQVLASHAPDELGHMARSGGDPRLGLDVVRATDLEPLLEIGPVLVVADDLPIAEGLSPPPASHPVGRSTPRPRIRCPARKSKRLPPSASCSSVSAPSSSMSRSPKSRRWMRSARSASPRSKCSARSGATRLRPTVMLRAICNVRSGSVVRCGLPKMWTSPVAPICRHGNVEQLNARIGRDVPAAALENGRVARPVEQRRNPQLQIQTRRDEHVGSPQIESEAWFGAHEMSVLVRIGDRRHLDLHPTDLTNELGVDRATS